MPKLHVILASTRPGRAGEPIAEWFVERAKAHGGFDVELVDLAEVNLPFMDEPNHPRLRRYTHDHTKAWSERVNAADAFVIVTPEYNYGFTAPLKNAIDFLHFEWQHKPVGFVSYGGVSGGTRGVVALEPVTNGLGLVRAGAAVEIPFAGARVENGAFTPTEKEQAILGHELAELALLAETLKPLQK